MALLSDKAFKNIISLANVPAAEKQHISAQGIRPYIVEKAEALKELLVSKLKNRMISLKVDAATCMDKSFFGVNIQFIEDGKIIIINLATKELKQRHTADNLRHVIKEILNDYSIPLDLLYSMTRDNRGNMKKLGKLLAAEQQEGSQDSIDTEDCEDEEMYDEFEINFYQVCDSIDLDEDEDDNLQLTSVDCAAHTLQLAVNDVIKDKTIQGILKRARELCKKLRNPTVRSLLNSMNKRKPILDCKTRWNSIADMLECLLSLRDCCTSGDLYMSDEMWDEIFLLLKALVPARKATKLLQHEQLIFGDLFKIWMDCILATEKIRTPFAKKLVASLENRQKQLFNNDIFVAAIYLDVRFQSILNEEQQERALKHLSSTYTKLKQLQNASDEDATPASDPENDENNESNSELEKYMRKFGRRVASQKTSNTTNIRSTLKLFYQSPRVSPETDMANYWKEKQSLYPEIFELYNVVMGVPITQVSVERLFSSLKFILSPLRYNLSTELLDAILFIRNNCW